MKLETITVRLKIPRDGEIWSIIMQGLQKPDGFVRAFSYGDVFAQRDEALRLLEEEKRSAK